MGAAWRPRKKLRVGYTNDRLKSTEQRAQPYGGFELPSELDLLRRAPLAPQLRPCRPGAVPAGETESLPEVCVSDGRVGCLHRVRRSAAVLDLIDLLLCFGLPANPPCDTGQDINGDGSINVLDLIDVLLVFGTACP